jgi:tetratricopeptide (TPR) repeat protein
LYEDDPDILIAMHRSPGASKEFREETNLKIQEMSQRHLELIRRYPDEPSFHNQWAWLVSNTEGDYAKAVEHSLRSLELSPDEASYLDTLARCYFAAGDLENAVKSQRRAVELAPHYQVMQRQLAQFERELAAKSK